MTEKEFQFAVETRQTLEFPYDGKNYRLAYEKDDDGKKCIFFGEAFLTEKFSSFRELMATAKIKNHFLREVIKELSL